MRFYPCLLSTALLFPFRNCMRSPWRSDRRKNLRDAGVIESLGTPDLNKAAGSKPLGFFSALLLCFSHISSRFRGLRTGPNNRCDLNRCVGKENWTHWQEIPTSQKVSASQRLLVVLKLRKAHEETLFN